METLGWTRWHKLTILRLAQANTQLSKGHRKRPKKQAWKFEHRSNRLHEMIESVQLTTGILYARIVIDEFADEISLMEKRLGSSKARTTTSSENGPFIGPAVSWEEVMMRQDSFGKWIKGEVRKLEVNDLVWIVDEKSTLQDGQSVVSLLWKRWASEISAAEN